MTTGDSAGGWSGDSSASSMTSSVGVGGGSGERRAAASHDRRVPPDGSGGASASRSAGASGTGRPAWRPALDHHLGVGTPPPVGLALGGRLAAWITSNNAGAFLPLAIRDLRSGTRLERTGGWEPANG